MIIFLIGAALGIHAPTPDSSVTLSREFIAMSTELRVSLTAPDRPAALQALEAAYQAVIETDGLLSTWHPSALDSLNHTDVTRATPLSAELAAITCTVLAWRDSTAGAFEPVSGALTDAWDIRGKGRVPDASALARALAATGPAAMTFTPECAAGVRHDAGTWLDSGGFGKGAALAHAAATLRSLGVTSAFLDFGGQLMALGAPVNGGSWTAAIADPGDRQRPVLRLRVDGVSASTSAQSEHRVTVHGVRYGHIMDPRTGRPAASWGSVTVLAADPLVADILSTALFVMGPDAGLAWADRHPRIGAVFLVRRHGRLDIRASSGARRFLDSSPSVP